MENKSDGKSGRLKKKFRMHFWIVCAIGTVEVLKVAWLMRTGITRMLLGYGLIILIEWIVYWLVSRFIVDTDTLLQPYSSDWCEKKMEIGIFEPLRYCMLWSCFLMFTVMRIGIITSLTEEMAWYMVLPIGIGIIFLFYVIDAVLIWMFLYMFNYRIIIGNDAVFLISFTGKLSRYGIDEITRLDNRYNYFSLVVGKENILLKKSKCSKQDVQNIDQAYQYLKDRVRGSV